MGAPPSTAAQTMGQPNVEDIMKQMGNTGSASIDEEDFDDFMTRVNAIDEAVKGLKDGNLSVEDVDKKYAPILDEPKKPTTKQKMMADMEAKKQKEIDRRKELARLPKSIDEAASK